MNEVRLSKDTVLRLGPGVAWCEDAPGVVTLRPRRGRVAGALAATGRRLALCLGGLLCVGAVAAASFVLGANLGPGLAVPALADAALAVPAPPPGLASLAPAPLRPGPPPRAAATPARAADPEDPFGLRR